MASIRQYIWLIKSIPVGCNLKGTAERIQVRGVALLERGIQVSRVSTHGRRGRIVMDDGDGIIMGSGRIDLSIHTCFTGLKAPVAFAQRFVEDAFPLELPA